MLLRKLDCLFKNGKCVAVSTYFQTLMGVEVGGDITLVVVFHRNVGATTWNIKEKISGPFESYKVICD